MGADDFRDYILGFIFYKYLSEKMHTYADTILTPDGIIYADIDESDALGKEYLDAVRAEALDNLGYFLLPSELFSKMAKRGNSDGKAKFILDDLTKVLNHIAQSTMGTDSEEEFDHLFDIKKLTSSSSKEYYRLRKGKYRVIFTIEDHDFYVHAISKRSEVYKKWP